MADKVELNFLGEVVLYNWLMDSTYGRSKRATRSFSLMIARIMPLRDWCCRDCFRRGVMLVDNTGGLPNVINEQRSLDPANALVI